MKVAIYVRVSTQEQTTLNQELELKEYCDRHGYEVYKIYKDEGVSGTKTTRPGLDLMLQDMRKKLFETILVWKYDRLGRSTIHLLQVLEEMRRKNITLMATSQNIDTSTPMGKWFVTNIIALGEMEREIITERINLGLKRARALGKHLGRPMGSKDSKRRRTSGYILRFAKEWQERFEKELKIVMGIDWFLNNPIQTIKREFNKKKLALITPQ